MNITPVNTIENSSFAPLVTVDSLCINEVIITKLELPTQPHGAQTITQTIFDEPVQGYTPVTLSPNRNMPTERNSEHNGVNKALLSEIGKWAEYFIFCLLREHYKKKFPTALILDTLDGFMFETQNKISYRLIWHNKQTESYKPRDFTLLKGKEERVIEVKGSVNETGIVHIPENEWGLMLQYKRHYRLFRVSNVGKDNVKVAKIKDPAQAIQNNQLIISKLEVKM